MMRFCYDRNHTWLIIDKCFAGMLHKNLYIAAGFSPRGRRHCVVMRGKEMVWDPHPDNAGLSETTEIWAFIPFDPSSP